jgi:hypothetical protein
MKSISLDAINIGKRQDNGTYTGILGSLQSGIVDMFGTDGYVIAEYYQDFLYTTCFTMQKYGALMKRQKESFGLSMNGLTAGISLKIYAILFAILAFLFIVSLINERFQQNPNFKNSIWRLFLSQFPANGAMWKHQTGVTRKVLMATSGFGILVLSSLYQAKQAEVLMIPAPPPVFTLRDIESLVSSGKVELLFDLSESPILTYISNVSTILADAVENNLHVYGIVDAQTIMLHNGVYINEQSILINEMTLIDPKLCENYLYISFDEWTRSYSALVMRKERVDLLESMNVIVAERMSYADDVLQSFQLHDECRKHIFPVYTPDPKYSPLQLMKISGALVFLFSFLGLSVGVLFLEIFMFRVKHVKSKVVRTHHLQIHFDDTIKESVRKEIYAKYEEILELIVCNS